MANSFGLHFRKLDLHTHTPASKCYKHPEHTPAEIVQAAIDKGLDAIAVTDHNSAGWIDQMKTAVEGKPLVIFPGVEISTHEGYHIVVLFDVSATQKEIELFLGELKFTHEQLGHSEALCKVSIDELIRCAHERKALVILAHIDGFKGAFSVLTEKDPVTGKIKIPNTCTDLFNYPHYDAVEVVNGKLPDGFEFGRGFKRFPAFYQSSDNPDPTQPSKHSKDGLAERYTWFKLDEITLEGLRQCFTDHDVRIRQMDTWQEKQWPRITSIQMGTLGFLANQQLEFHPGLNSIIGGKGAGKSLAIEFLRFGLAQPSEHADIRDDHVGKLDNRLELANTIQVELETDTGARYRVTRTYQGKGRGDTICINALTGEKYEGDITKLFPVLAYSQTEVIKIAENLDAQLRLVDSLIDTSPFENGVRDLQNQLTENNRAIARALSAREKVTQLQQDIATYAEKIKGLDSKLNSALLQQMRGADAKKNMLQSQQAEADQWLKDLQKYASAFAKKTPPEVTAELASDVDVTKANEQLEKTRQAIVAALNNAVSEAKAAQVMVVALRGGWQPTYDQLRKEYETQLAGGDLSKLEVERRSYADAQAEAARDLATSERLVKEELPEMQKRRAELLDALERQHQSFYAARKTKFDHLTNVSEKRLKLTLDHAANRTQFVEAVKDLWKGGGPVTISTDNRRKMAENLTPRQLVDLIIARDAPGLATAAGFTSDTAEKVINKAWLSDDFADVLALQHAYYPDDLPSIQFNKGKGQYAPLNELSVGQKCTALLIIALCDGTMPVIIDQPEDALDIASVWNDIALKLRRGKDSRQFILTTHNSTIAVGADSDSFMVLEPINSDRAKVSKRGAIDRQDVRREVIDHMEGGDTPYLLRRDKLNVK